MLYYKPFWLNTNKDDFPSNITSLLHQYQDVFLQELPKGLPPIRGIEHQIDFMPSTSLPNKSAYRANPKETQKIESQVKDLLEKGGFRKV